MRDAMRCPLILLIALLAVWVLWRARVETDDEHVDP